MPRSRNVSFTSGRSLFIAQPFDGDLDAARVEPLGEQRRVAFALPIGVGVGEDGDAVDAVGHGVAELAGMCGALPAAHAPKPVA